MQILDGRLEQDGEKSSHIRDDKMKTDILQDVKTLQEIFVEVKWCTGFDIQIISNCILKVGLEREYNWDQLEGCWIISCRLIMNNCQTFTCTIHGLKH